MRRTLGKRHAQVFALSLMTLINHSMTFSTSFAVTEMIKNSTDPNAHTVHWESKQVGYIQSAYLIGMAIFMLPAGYFSNSWSNRKFLSIGIGLTGICHFIIPFFVDLSWLAVCACRFLMGVCGASVSPCNANLLSRWAPVTERSRMSSFMTTSSALGNVLGASLSGILIAQMGWEAVFYVFGLLNIGLGFLLLLVLSDSPFSHPSISNSEKSLYVNVEEAGPFEEQSVPSPPWREMLTSWPVWAIIVAQCGVNWGTNTIAAEIPIYMSNVLNYKIVKVGMIYAGPYILLWVCGFLFGWISDTAIKRGCAIGTMRKIFNSIGCWGPAIFLIIIAYLEKSAPEWTVAALSIAIVLKAGNHCGFFISAIDISPRYAGSLTSMIVVIGTMFGSLAPITWGYIVEDRKNAHQWRIVLWLAAGVLFISNLFYVLIVRGTVQPWNNPHYKNRDAARETTEETS